jgi:hypothetical protein
MSFFHWELHVSNFNPQSRIIHFTLGFNGTTFSIIIM